MATIPEALALAVRHHQAGQLSQAEQIYRQILGVDPSHADALHLLGVIASRFGKHIEAIDLIGHAIAVNPQAEAYHCNLGIALKDQGKLDEAVASYGRALQINPDFSEAHSNLGIALKEQGKFPDAVSSYQRALQIKPNYAEAHFNLGITLKEQGKIDEAVACYRRALQIKPDYTKAHSNLGNALHEQGKIDEAVASYQRALQIKPDFADVHNNLGNALQEQGKIDEAVDCYQRVLQIKPDYAEAHFNLGNALREQGKLDQSMACYQRSLQIRPDYVDAHNNLGNALTEQRKFNEAVDSFQRALQIKPDYADAHNNLGNTLKEQGNLDKAVASHRRALQIKPDFTEAHYNLGNAFQEQGKLDEAMDCYQRALQIKPDYAEACSNLGNTFKTQGRLSEAAAAYRSALQIKPDFAEAHNNLGNAFKDQGKLNEAVACFQRALELKPDYAAAYHNQLTTLNYRTGVQLNELAEAHAEFDRRHAAPLRTSWQPHENTRDHDRPLRLGFLSPDFGKHPVGYFLIRVLENLKRRECEIIGYSDRTRQDEMTSRIQRATTTWSDVALWSDEQLAQKIRADRIDILFDLAGHTARNRLLVFARKPAPIQITWIGYVGTTGLDAMDYIVADRHEIPDAAEKHYCERVLRMPDGYVCYDPPEYAPPVSTLPAEKGGCVTFGNFNNPAKITSQVIEVWAKILTRVADSRLVLKYNGMNDSSVVDRFSEICAGYGVDTDRLTFLGRSPHEKLLGEYQKIDIALDPFPYSGGLTTCEALWMGVPVITCPGETFASRHSLSHLSNVGLTETVARDLADYVELASGLANDLPRLAKWRAELRERMAASPLCDGPGFAGNLMNQLRGIWREWCEQS